MGRNLGKGCRVQDGEFLQRSRKDTGNQVSTHGASPLPSEWDGSCTGVFLLLADNCSPTKTPPGRFSGCIFADSTARKELVEDFVALVRGGASESITRLAHKDLPTAQLLQQWGDAVQYNPEIIKLKVLPPPLPPAPSEHLGELCV